MTHPQYGKPETRTPLIPDLFGVALVRYGWREFIVEPLVHDGDRVEIRLVSTGRHESEIATILEASRERP